MAIFTSQSLKSATSGGLAALRFFQSNSVSQAFFKAVCSQLLRKPQRGKFFPCMKTQQTTEQNVLPFRLSSHKKNQTMEKGLFTRRIRRFIFECDFFKVLISRRLKLLFKYSP